MKLILKEPVHRVSKTCNARRGDPSQVISEKAHLWAENDLIDLRPEIEVIES
jgi:hypothetical protein